MGLISRRALLLAAPAVVAGLALLVAGALALFTDTFANGSNTFTTDSLDPPTGLSATGGSSITLNWTATADTYASGHRVFRSTTTGGPYSQIAEVTPRTTTTYTDNPAAGTYYYVMRAFYQSWESANSNEASATKTGAAMQLVTGTYTGDGTDNRAITGAGFQPDVVIIKGNTAQVAVIRTSTMTGDNAKPMAGASGLTADLIQSLDANGFTIGTDARVNGNTINYYWVAFKLAAGELKVSSYTGNGTSQSITGAGFSPEYVMVLSAAANAAVHRSSTMPSTDVFDGGAVAADRITSLDADGFTVGASSNVNTSGTTYHYVAWNVVAGRINVSSYAGNGTDNRNISGAGFQPGYVIIQKQSDGGIVPVHKPDSTGTTTDTDLDFFASANNTNGIQALQADGFQVGTNSEVNQSDTYHWMAFKASTTNTGFRNCTANAAVTTNSGDNDGFQLNPANACADDAAFAEDTNSSTGAPDTCTSTTKDRHLFYNYGFSVPAGSTINGIEVRLDAWADATAGSPFMCVELSWDGGTSWTTSKTTATLGAAEATFTLGATTDNWGRTWSATEFSDANFRLRITNVATNALRDFFLDRVAVQVTYISP
ncbi:MAG: hypothetical protein HYS09_06865 [Chloroflexi bacterium]|nr:hypothetical protein [Chloroflexota bacterium]